jgi:hypothetical protein
MGLTKLRAEQISDIDYKQAVRVITVSNITLSGGAPSQVDGVNLSAGNRILVTGQNTASQNGLYQVQTLGAGANGTWIRTSDSNSTGEIEAGMIVMVTEGNIYADTQWKLITNNPIVIGTTALTFTQNYSANSISAGTSNIVVNSNANVTMSSAGTADVLTVSNTGAFVSGVASASGNVTGGNILTAGLISATGNVTGNYFIGNGSQLTGLPAQYSNANVSSFLAAFGSNTISTTGNITGGNILMGGLISATSTITSAANITGGNITTAGLISATGNITGGNTRVTGIVSATGSVYGVELWATQSSGDEGGQLNLANPASNSTIAGNSVSVDIFQNRFRIFEQGGTARGAFIDITACGAGVGTNLLAGGGGTPGGANTQIQFNDSGTFGGSAALIFNKTSNAVTATGNITGGNILTGGLISATGTITGSSLTVTTGNVTCGNIVNGNANGVGNIGSSSTYFNTVFAKATSAQYADLAENYLADANYPPGTVVEFGGNNEVTVSSSSHSTKVAGIISTNPSYLMNATLTGQWAIPVALTGRVPCSVVGNVAKGDRLVASHIPGVAQALDSDLYEPGCIVAKALEAYNQDVPGVIEVAVGRT